MKTNTTALLPLFLLTGFAAAALAQSPTVDGQLDAAFYGAPLSVQNTPTGFGNATNGHVRFAVGGSELDAAYARVADGYLYLFIAGNLETKGVGGLQWPAGNLNKLDLFIDSIPGGQGQGGDWGGLRGDNADVDVGAFGSALDGMGHLDDDNDGLKFDAGFGADFYFTFNNYTEAVPWLDPPMVEAWRGILHYATLPTGGGGTAQIIGVARDSSHQSFTAATTFTNGVQLGFNNSNAGGVWGVGHASESDTSLAAAVATGLELAIPIQFLAAADGAINDNIRICAFVNNIDHTNLSNQVLGPMGQGPGGYGNLHDPRRCDFAADWSPGDQFFAAANPYPSARALLAPEFGEDNTLTHRWLGTYGHAYVLEVAPDLSAPVWSAVSGSVTSSLPVFSVGVTNPAPIGFYRSRQID